jgi:rhodanese-related sulfurtransferase
MEKVILTIFLAAAIAFGQQGGDAKKAPASQAKVLTRAEFDALLAKPDQVLLLDIRRPDEITNNGGFPAYLSIQFTELERNLAWIPRDRLIVTVSNHANRGGRAADLLASHGFKVAGTIGAQVYESQGGKLTKIVPPAPANNK